MSESMSQEAQLADELGLGLYRIDDLRRKARKAMHAKQFIRSGMIYAALATAMPADPDLAMHAAQNYEKGDAREDALRWFLAAAERYARLNHPAKADRKSVV